MRQAVGLVSVAYGEIMPVSSAHTYIMMHFYFLNDRFQDFFPASIPLYGQAIIAFVITFILAYVISKGAARSSDKWQTTTCWQDVEKFPQRLARNARCLSFSLIGYLRGEHWLQVGSAPRQLGPCPVYRGVLSLELQRI